MKPISLQILQLQRLQHKSEQDFFWLKIQKESEDEWRALEKLSKEEKETGNQRGNQNRKLAAVKSNQ